MTENEWLTSDNPEAMLAWGCSAGSNWMAAPEFLRGVSRRFNERKIRLIACAMVRMDWVNLCPESRESVVVAEQVADGALTETHREEAYQKCYLKPDLGQRCVQKKPELSPVFAKVKKPEIQANLIRDIVGNPFRPVAYPCCEAVCRVEAVQGDATTLLGGKCPVHGETYLLKNVGWLTPTVVSLARAAYDDRSGRKCLACNEWTDCEWCKNTRRTQDGTLDPFRLMLVADALEESGCDSLPLLEHLRGKSPCPGLLNPSPGWGGKPTTHVRGCWALDLTLGKE
jgi:hypothetical protein